MGKNLKTQIASSARTSMDKIRIKWRSFALLASIVFILIGIVSITLGRALPVFNDEQIYNTLATSADTRNDSSAFHEAQKYRTHKYELIDGGLFCVGIGLAGLISIPFIQKIISRRKLPPKVVLIGLNVVAIPLWIGLTAIGLFNDLDRGLFPVNADSIGLPIMSMVLASPFIIGISVILSKAVVDSYQAGKPQNIDLSKLSAGMKAYLAIVAAVAVITFELHYEVLPIYIAFVWFHGLLVSGYRGAVPVVPQSKQV